MISKPRLKSSSSNKYISNEKGSFFKGKSVDKLDIGKYITRSTKGWIYLTKPSNFYRGTRTFLLYGIKGKNKYGVDVIKQTKGTSQELTRVIELLVEIDPPLFIEISKVDNSTIGTLNANGKGTPVSLDSIPWESKALLLNNKVIDFTGNKYNCVSVLDSIPELRTLICPSYSNEIRLGGASIDEDEDEEIVYDSDLGG